MKQLLHHFFYVPRSTLLLYLFHVLTQSQDRFLEHSGEGEQEKVQNEKLGV